MLLSMEEVLDRHRRRVLPAAWKMTASGGAGVLARHGEVLTVERARVRPGDAICLVSGKRLGWRRAIDVRGEQAFVRADVAPFADGWLGDVVGRVRPRPIDRLAALAPARFVELGWAAAWGRAHAFATYRRLAASERAVPAFTARPMSIASFPRVRAFWLHACGSPLPLQAHPDQHVVGLFVGDGVLAGVNIQIVLDDVSYAAYTLVDRRFRGLGGGRKMIDVALGVARGLGVSLVYVHIPARNLPSIAAYEASGFRFARWWSEESDPLLAAERQWRVYERAP